MAIDDLKTQIARLPEQPGVYLYFDEGGETLYVGKARALRDRVRSYLGAWGSSPKTDALLHEIARLEVIVTDSVVEALALENNLIKQRSPKYNILLRDDKNYPYLQLTTGERFPRVLVARRVERDDHFYAGPFLPAKFARRTMALTHRLFGIRSCNEVITGKRGRPCLEYDIGRCIAPCVDAICSEEEYGRAATNTRLFLEGRTEELSRELERQMGEAAAAERFEQAAHLRDALHTVQTLTDRHQKMATPDLGARDVFGLALGAAGAVMQVFQVRGGRVVDRIELVTEAGESALTRDADVLAAALAQFYELHPVPAEIHLPVEVDEREALETWLGERAGRRVRLVVPKRGEKRGLLDLASRNALLAHQARFNTETVAHRDALETLQVVLALPGLPRRIECFDISTIQGRDTVASMVVCEDGRMRKGEYRKFRIRQEPGTPRGTGTGDPRGTDTEDPRGMGTQDPRGTGTEDPRGAGTEDQGPRTRDRGPGTGGEGPTGARGPGTRGEGPTGDRGPGTEDQGSGTRDPHFLDDFAAMRQVVQRHYRRVSEAGGPFPDLIVIDGGKGQLAAAYGALESLGLANLVALGLAKREELIYTRDAAAPIALRPNDPALLLLQRIRDEAHRFAVTFHRASRTKRDLASELDAIPGIGARRRRLLLQRFGSLAGVRRATREELEQAVGAKLAAAVIRHFAAQS